MENVYKKLQAARNTLQAMSLKKSGHNKFAGYQYFELGDFLQPINSIFAEVGLCGVVSFTKDMATLQIVNVDSPDQVITFTSPMGSAALKGCHEVQNIGAVETYQRRYLWVAALEIVEHDALDASEPSHPITLSDSKYSDMQDAIADADNVEAIAAILKSAVQSNATKAQLDSLRLSATSRKTTLQGAK